MAIVPRRRMDPRFHRGHRLGRSRSVADCDIAEVGRLGVLSRVKRFGMEPMTVEEAALRMQRLDHNFYMFLDAESNQYGVLYLRGDGDFGLIQPEEASS